MSLGLRIVYMYGLLLSCSAVNVEYLRRVNRLQSELFVDHYFSCNVKGKLIQWGANSESLGGYGMQDVGNIILNSRSGFNFTSILLSARPLQGQQQLATLYSVLLISVAETQNLTLDISCSNNIVINTTSTDQNPHYMEESNEVFTSNNTANNTAIALDYVLAAPILQNSSLLVHIIVCGTDSLSQFVGANKRAVGFGLNDDIGQTRSEVSTDNSIVNLQAILIARQPYETTSLAFITRDSNFTIICSSGSNKVQLQSRPEFSQFLLTTSSEAYPDTTSGKMIPMSSTLAVHTSSQTAPSLSSLPPEKITTAADNARNANNTGFIIGIVVVIILSLILLLLSIIILSIYMAKKKLRITSAGVLFKPHVAQRKEAIQAVTMSESDIDNKQEDRCGEESKAEVALLISTLKCFPAVWMPDEVTRVQICDDMENTQQEKSAIKIMTPLYSFSAFVFQRPGKDSHMVQAKPNLFVIPSKLDCVLHITQQERI